MSLSRNGMVLALRMSGAAIVLATLIGAAAAPSAAERAAKSSFFPGFAELCDKAAQIFEPAASATQRLLADPATVAAIDKAKQAVETLDTKIIEPAQSAAKSLWSDPDVRRSIDAAGAALDRAGAWIGQSVIDPFERSVDKLWRSDATPGPIAVRFVALTGSGTQLRAETLPPDEVGAGRAADDDPFEPFNRVMFGFNIVLDQQVFERGATLYFRSTSVPVRNGVRNFFANLREPVAVAANLLEGRYDAAGNATARFGINSVVGIGGVLDPATEMGYAAAPKTFEHTLCHYGVPVGPYVVLPILGSATLRDAAARLATLTIYYDAMGPYVYIPYRLADVGLQYADARNRIGFVWSIAIDPYIAQKALYLASRTLDCDQQAQAERELFPH